MDWRQHKINACRWFHADCPLPYNYDKKVAVARKKFLVRKKKVAVAEKRYIVREKKVAVARKRYIVRKKKVAVAQKRYIVRKEKVAVSQRYLHFFFSWTFCTDNICIFSEKEAVTQRYLHFLFQLDVLLMQSCYFFFQLELSHKDICIFRLISPKNFCHDTSMSNQPLQNLWNRHRLNSTRIRNIINWYQLQSVSD